MAQFGDARDGLQIYLQSKKAAFRGAAGPGATALGTGKDGRSVLAVGGADGTVQLWDPASGDPIGGPMTGHQGAILSLAFGSDHDGRLLLASGGADSAVRVWDATDGHLVRDPWHGDQGPVWSLLFGDSDGRGGGGVFVGAGGNDGTVELWDLASGDLIHGPLVGHQGPVLSLASGRFDNDSEGDWVLACGDAGGTITTWGFFDLSAPLDPLLTGHRGPVLSLAFGTLGSLSTDPNDTVLVLASGGADGTVRLWAPADGPRGEPLAGDQGPILSVAFLGNLTQDLTVAAGGADGTVQLWDLTDPFKNNPTAKSFPGPGAWMKSVAFGNGPGGSLLFADGGHYDGMTRVWDIKSGGEG